LNYQDIKINSDRVRQLSLSLAEECMENRASIQLETSETLANKRVVIAMDGGRTRTRVYEKDKVGRAEKFNTPWREPKMFVITTIDEDGKINKERRPIYDGTYGDDETFELLSKYLENLEIAESKIIEALDYYHAMEHLHDMKVYFEPEDQESYFSKLKDALWQGNFAQMSDLVKDGKRQNQIDYQSLKADNRPCGSGIIESAIRRIINLRFKSPSTFWYPENAEKLIFMRGVALSGRWEIMMKNHFY